MTRSVESVFAEIARMPVPECSAVPRDPTSKNGASRCLMAATSRYRNTESGDGESIAWSAVIDGDAVVGAVRDAFGITRSIGDQFSSRGRGSCGFCRRPLPVVHGRAVQN